MNNDFYRDILYKAPFSYAFGRVVIREGAPCDFEYVDINKAFEELTGKALTGLLEKTASETTPFLLNCLEDLLVNIEFMEDNSARDFYHEASGKWLRCIVTPKGRTHFTLIIFDIGSFPGQESIYNMIDNRLKQKTILLEALLDSIPDMVFFKNMESVYIGCNLEFSRLVGIDRDRIIGRTDYSIMPEKLAKINYTNDRNVLKQKKTEHFEEWLTYPDGTKKLFHVIKSPLVDNQGRQLGMLGIGRDTTERIQAVEELKKAKLEAEEA
ncbi:MAG: PAS domain-containing protein, partial [Clostridiales bacterium]|nr:PAS domain-containing protein [Clostridiales bacterium]